MSDQKYHPIPFINELIEKAMYVPAIDLEIIHGKTVTVNWPDHKPILREYYTVQYNPSGCIAVFLFDSKRWWMNKFIVGDESKYNILDLSEINFWGGEVLTLDERGIDLDLDIDLNFDPSKTK